MTYKLVVIPSLLALHMVMGVGCAVEPVAEDDPISTLRANLAAAFPTTECKPILDTAKLDGKAHADGRDKSGRIICRADFDCTYDSACADGFREKAGKSCPQDVKIDNDDNKIGSPKPKSGKTDDEVCEDHYKASGYDQATYNCAAAIADPDKNGVPDPDNLPEGREDICEPEPVSVDPMPTCETTAPMG